MRLSMMRAVGVAAIAAVALAACASHGMGPGTSSFVPSSQNMAPFQNGDMSPLATPHCATNPPQSEWIFKGACEKFTLGPKGGKFALKGYDGFTVTGSIGYNTLKKSITVYLADARDANGDVEKYKGATFPPYHGNGKTVLYAVADNQSTTTVKPVTHKGVPVIQYVITDVKGFPGKTCAAAILGSKNKWSALPDSFQVKNKMVTISVYTAPSGLVLPPKGYGLYFAINCYS